jgi:tetratricopeptide (TPR) repeat protein
VLVTSRAPLHLAAEREYNVQPLDVLDDALAIFVARARAADPSFVLDEANRDTVARICETVESLPLALELAAARVRVLTPEQLLLRLGEPLAVLAGGGRDAPARQQTLRATIDWSYELLDPDAQRLLARLAVFAGGCTLEAAESVCHATLEPLSALLDTSLLARQPGPRFRMLDTVREYALELRGDDARERHAEYFADFAERVGVNLVGPTRAEAMRALVVEHENLRAALAYSLERDLDLGFRIASELRSYWTTSPRSPEMRVWLADAFTQVDSIHTQVRVGALLVLGRQEMTAGDYEQSRATLERVADVARDLGCWSEGSIALSYLAWLSAGEHDDDGCRRLAEESIELARRAGDRWAERQALAMVAAPLVNAGDYEAAAAHLARSLAIARELGDPPTTVLALVNSSYAAVARGDLDRARPQLEEARELCRGLDEPASTVGVLQLLAWEASLSGERERARASLREALQLLRGGGRHSQLVDVLSEAAFELEETDPCTAAELLDAADAHPTARGVPAMERYGPLRERLPTVGGAPLTLENAVTAALAALG